MGYMEMTKINRETVLRLLNEHEITIDEMADKLKYASRKSLVEVFRKGEMPTRKAKIMADTLNVSVGYLNTVPKPVQQTLLAETDASLTKHAICSELNNIIHHLETILKLMEEQG